MGASCYAAARARCMISVPMAASSESAGPRLYRFGPYEADLCQIELRKFGAPLHLEPKPWQLLAFLLQRPGELVSRSQLQRELWADGTHVDFELGLNVAVRKLRATLCDSTKKPKYIETITGLGYRFVAKVECVPVADRRIHAATSTLLHLNNGESEGGL